MLKKIINIEKRFSLIVILAIIYNPHLPEQTDKMCDALKKIGENCGLASYFLSKTVNFQFSKKQFPLLAFLHLLMIFFLIFLDL